MDLWDRSTRMPNKRMQLTRPVQTGALQLIRSVSRTTVSGTLIAGRLRVAT